VTISTNRAQQGNVDEHRHIIARECQRAPTKHSNGVKKTPIKHTKGMLTGNNKAQKWNAHHW